MTENDLFKAVHAYAAHLDDHGPDLRRAARDALLKAIEAYAVTKELLTNEDMTRDAAIAWSRRVQLLEAKADVYDRVIVALPDLASDLWYYDLLESKGERDELTAAVAAVRELESKHVNAR